MQSTIITNLTSAFLPPHQPVCSIAPARFKAFVGLTRQLVELQGPRPIYVDNARLLQPIGSPHFWVDIDFANILQPAEVSVPIGAQPGEKSELGVSFGFLASAKEIGNLTDLVGKCEVTLHDHGTDLVFSNGYTEVRIMKPTPQEPTASVALPTEDDRLGEEVVVDDRDAVKRYVSKSGFVFLLSFAGQLEQVEVRGKRPCNLRKPTFMSLGGRSPDLSLTSSNFLTLAGKLDLSLGIYRNTHGYWLRTSSKPSMVNNLTTYELLYVGSV